MRTPNLVPVTALLIAGTLLADNFDHAVLAARRRWIEAYNRRDEQMLTAIDADDFRITFGDGRVQRKTDQLMLLRKPLPQGAEYEIVVQDSEVHVYGNAAVVTGVVTERGKLSDKQGVAQPFSQRSRYTDTWILQRGRWRVVA